MSTPYIRPANEHDVFVMEEIMRNAFATSYAHFMPEQYVREWYDNNVASATVRSGLDKVGVAEIIGRTVGFVMCHDNSITEMWVEPEFQGQGVGHALIDWVEAHFRQCGYATITLYCYESNADALGFYKKMRFRRASQFPSNDVSGGPVTVYNMLKMVTKLKG
jgi:ribosomal-protein-alanine N-acetyltransferase